MGGCSEKERELGNGYNSKVQAELVGICDRVTQLLTTKIIPGNSDDAEAMAFYCKMLGDYYRYLAEFAGDDRRNDIVPLAEDAYGKGTEWAQHLAPTHPVSLGLALNFSVFQHEVCRDTQKAIQTATEAFDRAAPHVTNDQEDAVLTLQLLQDNLQLWGAQ